MRSGTLNVHWDSFYCVRCFNRATVNGYLPLVRYHQYWVTQWEPGRKKTSGQQSKGSWTSNPVWDEKEKYVSSVVGLQSNSLWSQKAESPLHIEKDPYWLRGKAAGVLIGALAAESQRCAWSELQFVEVPPSWRTIIHTVYRECCRVQGLFFPHGDSFKSSVVNHSLLIIPKIIFQETLCSALP